MKRQASQKRFALGFTLLEVLFAVLVFSIVLVAIHTVFYTSLRLRNKAVEAVEQALPLTLATATIRRDLAGIVVPGGTLFGEFITTGQNSTSNLLSPGFYTTTGILSDEEPWDRRAKDQLLSGEFDQ
jgi:prepilin-type N-terminal cleavage/methylation domain-containing protein